MDDEYRTIVTDHAIHAMADIRDYIAEELLNPSAALSHMRLFREEIRKLSYSPGKYKVIDEQPWRDIGVRKIRAKNYYIYYWIDETAQTVYVTDVIYVGSDQPKWLDQMPMK